MTIEIALDPYKIDTDTSSFVVQKKDDYVKARFYIRDSFDRGTPIRVVVKNKGLIRWFKDLEGYAAFKTISPVKELKTLLNRTDLPKILIQNPQKIVDLKLINLVYERPIKPRQSSLDWILEVTIKFPWIRENLSENGDVSQVLEWLVRNKNANIDNALVQLCIEKIKVWAAKSPFKELLQWLESNPFERGYLFCLCQVLQDYPEPQKAKWLQNDEQWSTLCQLPNYTKWLKEIPPISNIDISPTLGVMIKEYLQERLDKDGLTIDVVKELSGSIKVEEDILYRYLTSSEVDKSKLSPDVIKVLKDKFKEGNLKDLLSKLIPVEIPPAITIDSKVDDIFNKWLQRYFLYRNWCRLIDKEDLLDEYIENFEGWIIKNYSSLLSTRPDLFVCGVRKIIHSLIEEGIAVLLVIIDGLSWYWADYIIKKFTDNHVYLEREPEMRFSMIPSVSEVSKPFIISGLNLSEDIRSQPLSLDYYNQLFADAYEKYIGKNVVATDSSDSLLNLFREDSRVYLYLFNEIDSVAHEYHNDFLRDSNIKNAIDKLVRDITFAVGEYERIHESKLKIIIIGDHGYLPLPKHFTKLSIDDSISCNHGRVAEAENIDGCYSLKLHNKIYSLAKGFNIVGKKPRGCVHGGLTPDELVVPFIIFSSIPPAQPLKPSLTLDVEIKRHNPDCPCIIEITNPNPYNLCVSRIEIDFVKLYDNLPITICPHSTEKINGILDASTIDEAKIEITYQIESACLGRDIHTRERISLVTKGAALADKSFEEEFDV